MVADIRETFDVVQRLPSQSSSPRRELTDRRRPKSQQDHSVTHEPEIQLPTLLMSQRSLGNEPGSRSRKKRLNDAKHALAKERESSQEARRKKIIEEGNHHLGNDLDLINKKKHIAMSEASPSVAAASQRLPNPRDINFADSKSALSLHLPQLTVEEMTELVLEEDGLFQRYMRDVQGFKATKMSSWTHCSQMSGSFVRTARCLIPLPQDLPAAVARLVKIPEVAEASMSWRVVQVENGLDIVMHNVNTDVPFGDRFVVQEVCRFRRHDDGGCVLSKSVGLVWVKPFSWSLKVIQKVIDYQVGVKSQAFDPAFAEFVKNQMPMPATAAN